MSILPDEKTKLKKRKYSRNGCIECKRRKTKCDEEKPQCSSCQRLQNPCVYPDKNAPKKPRKPRGPNQGAVSALADGNYSKELGKIRESYSKQTSETSETPERLDSNLSSAAVPNLHRDLGNDLLLDNQHMGSIQQVQSSGNDTPDGFFNILNDANLLVSGLADFDVFDLNPSIMAADTGLKPFHSNIILNRPAANPFFDENELSAYLDTNNTDMDGLLDVIFRDNTNLVNTNGFIPPEPQQQNNLDLIERIICQYGLKDAEERYFRSVAYSELVFYVNPFGWDYRSDRVMRVFLEYLYGFKYLLYALLALLSLLEYTKTLDRIHDRNQKKYTTICMRLLVLAFDGLKDSVHLLRNIEGLVLTVLTLTMTLADVTFVDTDHAAGLWVEHLNGARDLLTKYNKIKERDIHSAQSNGILVAKLLFYSYEFICRLGAPLDQVDVNETILSLLLEEGPFGMTRSAETNAALHHLGIFFGSPSLLGFNVYLACTADVVKAALEVLKLVQYTRRCEPGHYRQVPPAEVLRVMAMVEEALKQQIVPGIGPDFVIKRDLPAHPEYTGADKVALPPVAFGTDVGAGPDGSNVYYLFFDLAQQLQTYFIYMKLLGTPGLMCLPRHHPFLRAIIARVMEMLVFVRPKSDLNYRPENVVAESENYYLLKALFDYKAVMIQLVYRVVLHFTDDLDIFERLELFFEGLVKLCVGSAYVAVLINKRNRNAELVRRASGGSFTSFTVDTYKETGEQRFPLY